MSRKKQQTDTWIGYLPKSRSVIEITSSKNAATTKGKGTVEGIAYQKLGDDDKLADEILEMVWQNDFMPQLLLTEASFLYGGGLQLFRKRLVSGTVSTRAKIIIEPAQDAAMEAWAKRVFLNEYFLKACYQFVYNANVYTGFNLTPESRIANFTCYDFPNIRAERSDDHGQIPSYLIFGEKKKDGKVYKFEQVPRYRSGIEKSEPQFIFHSKLPTPGQAYYGLPAFYGAMKTIKLLNQIPDFHLSGLENGYNIKYHVKVPDVWLDQFGSQEDKDKAWEKLREDMDEQLSSKDNVNKTIISKFVIDRSTGKPLPGFDIIPMDNNQTDQAYLALGKDMRINAGSAVGIHPGLANVDTGGKLGGTASEMRVAADLHLKLRTPIPRMKILQALEIAYQIEGFPSDLFFAPIDVELITTDQNPNGKQTVTSSANAPV
jgi:hypothetical protein